MTIRISFVDTPDECRLVVEGKLTSEDVSELQSTWDRFLEHARGQKMVVDLNHVIAIHRGTYPLLSSIVSEGVDVVASGVFNKHLLEELKKQSQSGHEPSLEPGSGDPTS